MDIHLNNICDAYHLDDRFDDYEVWTANDSLSLARCSNDRIVINFSSDTIKVVTLFTNSIEHITSKVFEQYLLGFFKKSIQEEVSFRFQKFYLADASDYYPTELITLSELLKYTAGEEEIHLASVRRTMISSMYEHWRFLWNNKFGYHSEDHVLIETQTLGTKVTIFTAQPFKLTNSAFIDQLCGLLNFIESYSVHFVLCDDPFDLSVDEEIEQAAFSKMLFSKKQDCAEIGELE